MGFRLALLITFISSVAVAKPRWEELPLPPPMPAAETKGSVEHDGAKIYYATYGKGTPVILLHGGLGNSDHFGFQVPALAAQYQVITIDSRGQGRSTMTRAKLTYQVMANDVVAVMDALKVPRASIVGWSDGGEIALDLAIDHPDRVDRIFVFGANYDANGSKPRDVQHQTFNDYAVKCRSDYEKMSKTPRAYNTVVDALLPVWRNPTGITKDQLRSIQAPTMMADGDHDEVIELDQVKEMAQLIPNGQLKVFTDTSHFALWQDPKTFTQAILDFLK
jgi:pimeloyl-ACP methyl ester carboxylesterase